MAKEKENKNTSWGNVSLWYDNYLSDDDTYQSKVILPNLLRLLDVKKGDKIIDPACGQGFFVRELSKVGAEVFASDISSNMIDIARQKEGNIKYFVSPAHDLSFARNGFFDKAVVVLAFENIENYKEVILEISKKLKDGGSLVIVFNHPAFRIPKRSSWHFDEERNIQSRIVDEYMSESKVEIEMNPGSGGDVKTISFHRPLQSYFKAFEKAGFTVSRLEEWISHKESEIGPRKNAEDKSRREFPMFMAVKLESRK